MRATLLPWLLASTASAQFILDAVSFGHNGWLSPNGRALPGWTLSGENHQVQLLSDRIILTPPVPGSARGAIWSDNAVSTETWTAELEFRASGQDQGTGNLNVWLAKDKNAISANSVYTVENFDGLVLVVDQYGGTGGKVRGFLNDGSRNYKATSNPESLAFGHCDYSYRNLGRPSRIRIVSDNGLAVYVDDRECFRTDRINLPSGYYFGITAATGENPDSFEVNKFVVSSVSHPHDPAPRQGAPPTLERLDRFPGSPEAVPDKPAEEIKSQEDQFADLHNRLQGMTHQVANIFAEFDLLSRKIEDQHQRLMNAIPASANVAGSGQQISVGAIEDLKRRIDGVQQTVQQIERDIHGKDYRQHLNDLQRSVESLQGGLTEHLPETLSRCKLGPEVRLARPGS